MWSEYIYIAIRRCCCSRELLTLLFAVTPSRPIAQKVFISFLGCYHRHFRQHGEEKLDEGDKYDKDDKDENLDGGRH